MKQICFFILCTFVASFYGCKPNEPVSEEYDHMKVSIIFKKDSVLKYASLYGEFNKDVAEKYAAKANALLSNDFRKAEYYYKKALTLYPNDKIYIEYGNALYEKGRYENAEEAYEMALELNAAQTPGQYFTIFKTGLLAGHPYMYDELGKFKSQLYSYEEIKQKVINDEIVKKKISPIQIQNFSQTIDNVWELQTYDASESSEGGSFADYVKQFDPLTLPYSAKAKELRRFAYVRGYFEGEDYDPTTDFSRFEENSLFKTKSYCETDFQHKVKEGDDRIILIHAADSSYDAVPADFRCVWHRLLVFNNTGELLDSRIIGMHAGDKLTTYSIGENLVISTESFSRKWKKPFVRNEIDNEIVSTEKTGDAQYKITDAGKIEEVPLTQ